MTEDQEAGRERMEAPTMENPPAPDVTPWRVAIRNLPDVLARHAAIGDGVSVADALAAFARDRLDVMLVEHGGPAHALTRGDLERVLPSPATALARHEIPELLRRVTVRHALRAPAATIDGGASLLAAAHALRDAGWRPVVVRDGKRVWGVVTAESVLAALARRAPSTPASSSTSAESRKAGGQPRAALSVFTRSIARVIGPTPPGTGVIALAIAATGS
ncbi:MAG: CBS domain-containing protein [Dehalococcoidia bacterium]